MFCFQNQWRRLDQGAGLLIASVPVHPSPEIHIMRLYTYSQQLQQSKFRNRTWILDTATHNSGKPLLQLR